MQDIFDAVIDRARYVQRDAQKIIDLDLMIGYTIDEVSVLCGTPQLLDKFVGWAIDIGYEHFNSVPLDVMRRQDQLLRKQKFEVRFEFLRIPGENWRIEAMCIPKGSAPLHSQHQKSHGDPSVVHASFKCINVEDYQRVKTMFRGFNTMPYGAEYRNSYGVFSYWQIGSYYMKPRVNLRDMEIPR